MRTSFISALIDCALADERIQLLTGDLGFGLLEAFRDRLPGRFLNVGVAEQNLIGIAAGLALSGKIVFVYSIANFPTLRCFEQIRNDLCYQKLSVKIVSAGCGLCYGPLGSTHHATEDYGALRVLPEITLVAPGDPLEASEATRALAAAPGPAYLRLGKSTEPAVHQDSAIDFALGRAIRVRDGSDCTLIATGTMLHAAVAAADALARQGLSVRVLSMHTIKPLDAASVIEAATETGVILTVEEHSIVGGLGTAVAELLAESDFRVPFRRIGIPPAFIPQIGSHDYLKEICQLSPAAIESAIAAFVLQSSRASLR